MAKFYAKAPDGSDALLSIVLTGFTQSLQQNGWCKLPNGLLFQWNLNSNEYVWNNFSLRFTNLYSLIHVHTNASSNLRINIGSLGTSYVETAFNTIRYFVNRYDGNTANGGNMISIGL